MAYRDEKFSEVYKNDTAIDVLDETISYFVEHISTIKVNDDYVFLGFLNGRYPVEQFVDYMERTAINTYGPEFKDIVTALMPLFRENLLTQKERYEKGRGKEKETYVIS